MTNSTIRIHSGISGSVYISNLEAWEYFRSNPLEAIASFSLEDFISHLGFLNDARNLINNKSMFLAYISHFFSDKNDEYFREHIIHVRDIALYNLSKMRTFVELPSLENVESIAYLHDTIEDTDLPYDIIYNFDPYISTKVLALTDPAGPTRQDRKAGMYNRIISSGTVAIYVKICDRIANYERCSRNNNVKKMKMYISEHNDFRRNFSTVYNFRNSPIINELDSTFLSMVRQYETATGENVMVQHV